MKKQISIISIILTIIIVSTGCITLLESPKHDTLVIAYHCDPGNFYPWNTYSPSWCILDQIYSFLGMLSPGSGIYTNPGLAENWTESTDKLGWTYTLRENLKFHDGTKVTAEDIEYSFKASAAYGPYKNVGYSIDHIADPTFEKNYFNFTYDSPESLTFTISSTTWFPDPLFKWDMSGYWRGFTIIPKGSLDTNETREGFWNKPISAGPYMLKSEFDYQSGESITLTRFDDWFGWGKTITASNGEVYIFPKADKAFKSIQFKFIYDPEIQLIEFSKGLVDVVFHRSIDWFTSISQETYVTLNKSEDILVVQPQRLGGAVMLTNIQGDYPTIYGGPGNFPVSEVWFRKAISHVINRTKVVEIAHNGVAAPRSTIFPEFIEDEYSNLDTTDYYDFSFNISKAQQLLDSSGYTPLNFTEEPDNRFGYGSYANETELDGELQTKGHHFILKTLDGSNCLLRAREVQKDLLKIGIYTDLIAMSYNEINEIGCSPGIVYNETGQQPDPNYKEADFDFLILGFEASLETPSCIISLTSFTSFGNWYLKGWPECGWLNADFEIGRYKYDGDLWGNIWWLPYFIDLPPDMSEEGYPIPEWSNEDEQYIEGCIQAGRAVSYELPSIPLIWYIDTYIMKSNVLNLLFTHTGIFNAAYTYWD